MEPNSFLFYSVVFVFSTLMYFIFLLNRKFFYTIFIDQAPLLRTNLFPATPNLIRIGNCLYNESNKQIRIVMITNYQS